MCLQTDGLAQNFPMAGEPTPPRGKIQLQYVNFGQRIFPANFYLNRKVGNDIVIEFIFDDGLEDTALSLLILASPKAAAELVRQGKQLLEALTKADLMRGIPAQWTKKPLEIEGPPVRITNALFGRSADTINMAFGYLHPNLINPKDLEKVAEGGETVQVPIVTVAEAALEYSQFCAWVDDLSKLLV